VCLRVVIGSCWLAALGLLEACGAHRLLTSPCLRCAAHARPATLHRTQVLDTIAELEAGPAAGDSSSEDDDDLLDWRAKKSAF
jgi:hypothetical protein